MAGSGGSDLKLGHHGAGDDCMTKMVRYGSGGALAGLQRSGSNWNKLSIFNLSAVHCVQVQSLGQWRVAS